MPGNAAVLGPADDGLPHVPLLEIKQRVLWLSR